MKWRVYELIRIISVSPASPAAKAGIQPDESLISINGEPVLDEIDYQALIQHPHLEISLSGQAGGLRNVSVAKSAWEPLGLQLFRSLGCATKQWREGCG